MDQSRLSEKIRKTAESAGIDALGFAAAAPFDNYAIANSKRRDPALSLPDAKTIIVAGIYIGGITLPVWSDASYGRTSRLFLSGFFLDMVDPLKPIARLLEESGHKAMICKGYSQQESILPLKLSAIRAGLGWKGKHSLLISKKYGTFLALGGILTTAELEHNAQTDPDRCRNCKKCQEACPVSALDQAYALNMKKCMSYRLQVGNLPVNIQAAMENRVADCEICQDSCPWNKKHLDHPLHTPLTASFQDRIAEWEKIFHLSNLIRLSKNEYDRVFGPLKTDIPFEFFHRNVMAAAENAPSRIRSES